jgi:hypothetical protein
VWIGFARGDESELGIKDRMDGFLRDVLEDMSFTPIFSRLFSYFLEISGQRESNLIFVIAGTGKFQSNSQPNDLQETTHQIQIVPPLYV